MLGWMAIGYGTADGSGWVDIGLSRRFLMLFGFMAAGQEDGAGFNVSGGVGVKLVRAALAATTCRKRHRVPLFFRTLFLPAAVIPLESDSAKGFYLASNSAQKEAGWRATISPNQRRIFHSS